jgi:hypothetical protein
MILRQPRGPSLRAREVLGAFGVPVRLANLVEWKESTM